MVCKRVVGILNWHTERLGLVAIHICKQLLAVGFNGGVYSSQLLPRLGFGDDLFDHF